MQKRAEEEERALKERAEIEARERDERERRVANELLSQLQDDARRKEDLQRQEIERRRARRRALSDATEKPNLEVSTASFDQEVVIGDVRFDTVRLFHGRQGMRITINYKLSLTLCFAIRMPWNDTCCGACMRGRGMPRTVGTACCDIYFKELQ